MMFKVILIREGENMFMEEYTKQEVICETKSFLEAKRTLDREFVVMQERVKGRRTTNSENYTIEDDQGCWGTITYRFDLIIE